MKLGEEHFSRNALYSIFLLFFLWSAADRAAIGEGPFNNYWVLGVLIFGAIASVITTIQSLYTNIMFFFADYELYQQLRLIGWRVDFLRDSGESARNRTNRLIAELIKKQDLKRDIVN